MKFRFVDRIEAWEPWRRISGRKTVSFEEYSVKEPFGDEPHLPESLVLESLLQLGNWLVLLSSDFRTASVLLGLDEIRFQGTLRPGERLDMRVDLLQRREDGFVFAGEGTADGRRVVTGARCLAGAIAADALNDPADLRLLFSELQSAVP
jgi:3-hydroxymyristoyl/3-hydroxydecanoyl-(acyl carrier protein) dehydratase